MKIQLENSQIKTYLDEGNEAYLVLAGHHSNFENAIKLRNEVRQQGYPGVFVTRDQ